MKSRAPATRPVYRVKAQPANEGGYAVLRGAQVVFDDLHRTLASALAHDLNAAVGSGRTYRCGPQSVRWSECKILASDGMKVKTPRLYVGEALAVVKELNRAAEPRENPGVARRSRWFDGGPDRVPPMPRLSRQDYRRLLAHAKRGARVHTDTGDDIKLSVGSVFAAPDGEGGTRLWFSADPRRSGVYYELSASTLKRRATAE